MEIIPILSYFYTAVFNSYALSLSSLNTAPSKPYMTYHISLELNFKDELNENKGENEVSGDIKIESIDYERGWVRKVDLKERIWVDTSLFSLY